jgi:hypothetical protein
MADDSKPASPERETRPTRDTAFETPAFDPVPVRPRHDGWTPEKQIDFIEALAASGCVEEACEAVGMASSSAYRLRARADAQSFRYAWDFALDYAIARLSDAVFSRAIHGVARPVFYKGEVVGERRYYDERLAMWLLRHRDPVRYGAWRDDHAYERHPDGPALSLSLAVNRLTDDACLNEIGAPPCKPLPLQFERKISPEEEREIVEEREDRRVAQKKAREAAALDAELDRWAAAVPRDPGEDDSAGT